MQLSYLVPRLHPKIEEGTDDQQEEDAREENLRERIGLMEVAPREDHRQANGGNPDHLALERDAHGTPTRSRKPKTTGMVRRLTLSL